MTATPGCGVLWGWNAIADYLGVTTRTAQRWRCLGLPASYLNGRVKAWPEDLRVWVEAFNDAD